MYKTLSKLLIDKQEIENLGNGPISFSHTWFSKLLRTLSKLNFWYDKSHGIDIIKLFNVES